MALEQINNGDSGAIAAAKILNNDKKTAALAWSAADEGATHPTVRVYEDTLYQVIEGQTAGTASPADAPTVWRLLNGSEGLIAEYEIRSVSGGAVYKYIAPLNKTHLIKIFNDPLCQYVSIKIIGDSVSWGQLVTGMASIEPRNGTLTDTRNNSTSNSWVNLLHRYVGGSILNSHYTYTESLTPGAQGGVNIFSYKKEINLLPKISDVNFNVVNNSAATLKSEWVESYYADAYSQGFLSFTVQYSTDEGRIDFKFTGNNFKLRYAQISDGARYELFVNNVSQGIFSTQVGDMGNSSSSGVGFIKNHAFAYIKDGDISIRVIAGDIARVLFRIENIVIPREIKITNQGINGTTAAKYLTFIDDVLETGDSMALIMLGINDRYAEIGAVNSINAYENAIIGLINKCIDNGTIPILMCPTAVVTEDINDGFTIGDVRNSLKKIADLYNLIFIDHYKDTYDQLNVIPYILADGTHPSDEGSKDYFKRIKAAIL